MAASNRKFDEPALNLYEDNLLDVKSLIREFSTRNSENLLVLLQKLAKFLSCTERKRFSKDFQELKRCVKQFKTIDISCDEEGLACCMKLQQRFGEILTHFKKSRNCGRQMVEKLDHFMSNYGNFH